MHCVLLLKGAQTSAGARSLPLASVPTVVVGNWTWKLPECFLTVIVHHCHTVVLTGGTFDHLLVNRAETSSAG